MLISSEYGLTISGQVTVLRQWLLEKHTGYTRGPKGFIKCTWVQCATFFWWIGQGGDFNLLFRQKNLNFLKDVEILLPVKFHWIPSAVSEEKSKNVSANQRPGRPSCFSDRPEKHKLSRWSWDLASCQVSMNSVQQFQRRSQKHLSQSETRVAILFFR